MFVCSFSVHLTLIRLIGDESRGYFLAEFTVLASNIHDHRTLLSQRGGNVTAWLLIAALTASERL